MSCYAKKVVETAMLEIGYKESGKNITKYASYFDKNYPDFYNTKKQGAEWCDIFVDYCILVNCADMNEALYVTCQPTKSCGAGCSFSYDYYKKQGRVGNDPQIGAQIFFGTGKKPTHTGIVVDVYGDSVVTVEGNSDNMVKRHTYKQSSSRIFGYGYPRYSEEPAEPAPAPAPQKSVTDVAKEVIDGKWGNNPERKQKLTEAGYDYNAVQTEVNRLLKGTTPAPAPAPTSETWKVKTNGSPLALRVAPNKNAALVIYMKNGSTVQVSGEQNGWSRATYNGMTGWAYSKWLSKS